MCFKKFLTAILLLPICAFAQQVKMPDGWTDGYTYANGIRIHYYHTTPQPEKPVIVMVHGVTDNGLCWTTLALNLQKDYNIYMLDARGHGLTDPFMPGDDGETLIKDVVEFTKAMKFNNPILMGHSMGAATVMRLGASYPEVARAIIMLDPILKSWGSAPPPMSRNKPTQTPPRSAAAPAAASNRLSVSMFASPETLVAQNNYSFTDLVATGHKQNPMWADADIEYWALSKKQYHGPYSAEAAQVMTGTMNIGKSLAGIKVPAIILKADAPADVRKTNEETASVMQKGKLVHIDGAAHNLHHDKLERTTQVIKEFLATL